MTKKEIVKILKEIQEQLEVAIPHSSDNESWSAMFLARNEIIHLIEKIA